MALSRGVRTLHGAVSLTAKWKDRGGGAAVRPFHLWQKATASAIWRKTARALPSVNRPLADTQASSWPPFACSITITRLSSVEKTSLNPGQTARLAPRLVNKNPSHRAQHRLELSHTGIEIVQCFIYSTDTLTAVGFEGTPLR